MRGWYEAGTYQVRGPGRYAGTPVRDAYRAYRLPRTDRVVS